MESEKENGVRVAEARILTEEDAYEHLGFSFPPWKKWAILTSIFVVQISMNFGELCGEYVQRLRPC